MVVCFLVPVLGTPYIVLRTLLHVTPHRAVQQDCTTSTRPPVAAVSWCSTEHRGDGMLPEAEGTPLPFPHSSSAKAQMLFHNPFSPTMPYGISNSEARPPPLSNWPLATAPKAQAPRPVEPVSCVYLPCSTDSMREVRRSFAYIGVTIIVNWVSNPQHGADAPQPRRFRWASPFCKVPFFVSVTNRCKRRLTQATGCRCTQVPVSALSREDTRRERRRTGRQGARAQAHGSLA